MAWMKNWPFKVQVGDEEHRGASVAAQQPDAESARTGASTASASPGHAPSGESRGGADRLNGVLQAV